LKDPNETRVLASRHASAVVVVDMQNDYCTTGGAFDAFGADVSACEAVVPNIEALCAGARRSGVPVVMVRTIHQPDAVRTTRELLGGPRGHCRPNSWGAEWVRGLEPQPQDSALIKRTYSAFFETELGDILRSQNRQVVVLAGCATEVCVETTARHAYLLGLLPIVARDAVVSHDTGAHAAALHVMGKHFGIVASVSDLIEAWEGSVVGVTA
jgi:ureidoacrylate peracid hydrolase